jgi:Tfp pilus assembly protein PilF
MTFAWKITLLVVSSISQAVAQGVSSHGPVTAECVELNQKVVAPITNGQFALAEGPLSTAVASGADRALVHATGAVLLHAQGRLPEAEAEYLLTFQAWEEAGQGKTVEAGAALNSFGSLYVRQGRFEEARRTLDRALLIFASAKDAVPSDRIKTLHVRGVLARQRAWRESEQNLSDALTMAGHEPSSSSK